MRIRQNLSIYSRYYNSASGHKCFVLRALSENACVTRVRCLDQEFHVLVEVGSRDTVEGSEASVCTFKSHCLPQNPCVGVKILPDRKRIDLRTSVKQQTQTPYHHFAHCPCLVTITHERCTDDARNKLKKSYHTCTLHVGSVVCNPHEHMTLRKSMHASTSVCVKGITLDRKRLLLLKGLRQTSSA